MPSFTKGGGTQTPFGKNQYLRSTVGLKFESYTLAASTVTATTIDGVPGQKIAQPGLVMAKIMTGLEAGKIGPYQAAGTAEVQTLTESGTISGGTFTVSQDGKTTAPIAYNAVAADVQTALHAAGINAVVTGGPVDTVALTLTFQGGNVSQVTADTTALTGTTPGITVATGTPGAAGANDGRQTAANIVGILDTFLPWQLMEHDVEVAVLTDGTVVQGWCFEYNAAGAPVTLSNTTADAVSSSMPVFRGKRLDIKFA